MVRAFQHLFKIGVIARICDLFLSSFLTALVGTACDTAGLALWPLEYRTGPATDKSLSMAAASGSKADLTDNFQRQLQRCPVNHPINVHRQPALVRVIDPPSRHALLRRFDAYNLHRHDADHGTAQQLLAPVVKLTCPDRVSAGNQRHHHPIQRRLLQDRKFLFIASPLTPPNPYDRSAATKPGSGPQNDRTGTHTFVRVRHMTDSNPRNYVHAELLGGVQRRRRWTPEEKLRMVEETFLPGNSVSLVARMHGVAPNQLFGWRRQAASGALTATRAVGEVVPASEYRALENQVRELQRMLGKKTMENEILREAISRVAGPKKTALRTISLPEGDL